MEDYSIEQSHPGRGKILWLIAALGLAIILVAVSVYYAKAYRAVSQDSFPTQFILERGFSTRQTANSLSSQKLIDSPLVFIIYTYLNHASGKIQAGEYQLNRNMSVAEIVDVLTYGKVVSNERTLTIIEGWTNAQIEKYLMDRQLVVGASDFESTLSSIDFNFKFANAAKKFDYQGFLYPDTYKIAKDEGSFALVTKMLKNFETKLANQTITGDQLILASIIEKEVGRNGKVLTQDDLDLMQKERVEVASVFYNRLRIGMPLESDATVNYITGKFDRSVTIADTKIKSPYNTYQVKGLPPAPISNPGIGSIQAAIDPASSDYLYFLNAPDGTAYFAKTLAEHNANKAKYLK